MLKTQPGGCIIPQAVAAKGPCSSTCRPQLPAAAPFVKEGSAAAQERAIRQHLGVQDRCSGCAGWGFSILSGLCDFWLWLSSVWSLPLLCLLCRAGVSLSPADPHPVKGFKQIMYSALSTGSRQMEQLCEGPQALKRLLHGLCTWWHNTAWVQNLAPGAARL